ADLSELAPPGSQYPHRVMDLAVRLVVEDGLPYRPASWHLWRDHRVFVPFATIQNWVEAGGEKSAGAQGAPVPRLGLYVSFPGLCARGCSLWRPFLLSPHRIYPPLQAHPL